MGQCTKLRSLGPRGSRPFIIDMVLTSVRVCVQFSCSCCLLCAAQVGKVQSLSVDWVLPYAAATVHAPNPPHPPSLLSCYRFHCRDLTAWPSFPECQVQLLRQAQIRLSNRFLNDAGPGTSVLLFVLCSLNVCWNINSLHLCMNLVKIRVQGSLMVHSPTLVWCTWCVLYLQDFARRVFFPESCTVCGLSLCGGLNANSPHRLIGSGTIGRYGLFGGRVSAGVGFEASEAQDRPSIILFLSFAC